MRIHFLNRRFSLDLTNPPPKARGKRLGLFGFVAAEVTWLLGVNT
jgi:hypothetical protein